MNDSTFGWSSTTTFIAYLLILRQVKMSTSAAITHTAFVGSTAAVISPAPNAITVPQLLHRLITITSVYTTPRGAECDRHIAFWARYCYNGLIQK